LLVIYTTAVHEIARIYSINIANTIKVGVPTSGFEVVSPPSPFVAAFPVPPSSGMLMN